MLCLYIDGAGNGKLLEISGSRPGRKAMRIISGKFKRRQISYPKHIEVIRPTIDRVRETVFNVVGDLVFEANVLDLCAGSGILGIEALSRGANSVLFADVLPESIRSIKKNLAILYGGNNFESFTFFYRGKVERLIPKLSRCGKKYEVIFFDPPYMLWERKKNLMYMGLFDILAPAGLVVIEYPSDLFIDAGNVGLFARKRFGRTEVSFFTI